MDHKHTFTIPIRNLNYAQRKHLKEEFLQTKMLFSLFFPNLRTPHQTPSFVSALPSRQPVDEIACDWKPSPRTTNDLPLATWLRVM
jgi:hypothetical protein